MRRFLEILRFELVRQLSRPLLWLFVAVFGYLAFAATSDGVTGAGRSDDVFFNAPVDVAAYGIIVGMISLMVAAVLAGDAAARDAQTRIDPLVYALPLGRVQYLLGRFLAPFLIHAVVLLVAVAGIALLPLLPAADPEIMGPFRPGAFAMAYLWFMLPNALFAHAIMFATASLTRRAITAFAAGGLLFFLSLFVPEFIGGQLQHWTFARWFDPSGYAAVRIYMDTWAPAQQNALLLPMEGMILWNRLFWLGAALLVVGGLIARFRFAHHAPRASGRSVTDLAEPDAMPADVAVPRASRTFDAGSRARQLAAAFALALRQIAHSRGILFLLVGPVLLFFAMPEMLEHIGVPLEPSTSRLLLAFQRAAVLSSTIPLVLVLVFTGELIWSERDARLSAMVDAAPVPDWVLMTGKLLALLPMLLVHQALLFAVAIGVQRVLGYTNHDFALLAQGLFGVQMVDYVLFGALAVAVHALVNHKYVGHLVMIVVWMMSRMAYRFGIEHDMLAYSSAPAIVHSDMTGYGWSVGPWLWHKLYWLGWALLLLAAARVLWPRGGESALLWRLRAARVRLRSALPLAIGAAAIVVVAGGFTFWNTNVLNEHTTAGEGAARRAAYERAYSRYAGSPQPALTAMSLRVGLHPSRGRARIDGRYVLANRGAEPIDTLHIATSLALETDSVRFDRPARALARDARLGHGIYLLERPLAPGDSIVMSFVLRHEPRGFGGRPNPVRPNGVMLDQADVLPRIGYQRDRELVAAAERRKRGMPARVAVPPLEDVAARYDPRRAAATSLDIVIATDSGHTAVAPGRLRRSWIEDGRRWFHYTTDVPVRDSWVLLSARYARRTGTFGDVDIEVLYHPGHTAGVERLLRSVRTSLADFTERFGPYPFGTVRFAESPGWGTGASAHPGFVDFDEGFAILDASRDRREIDFVFGVVAHEVAHQWWGHQLVPAYVEGAPLLTESLAWYSALGAVEREYGREHLRRMLAMLRESYLTPRTRAGVPLLRADDWFQAYRKGAFAMQALREYIGQDEVDGALRALLGRHAAPNAPLATSLDLYAALQAAAPDSMQYLLHDLFEENTYWDLRTDSARAERIDGDRWRVTLDVRVSKSVVDTAGVESARPMNDHVDVAVFGAAPAPGARGAELYRERRRLASGSHRLVVEVTGEPERAGIDPDAILIDTYDGDNVEPVSRDP